MQKVTKKIIVFSRVDHRFESVCVCGEGGISLVILTSNNK